MTSDVKAICQAHAEWFGDVLRTLVVPVAATFMEHGWKHGVEAQTERMGVKPCGCPGGPVEHLMSCCDPRFMRAEIERLAQQNASLETELATLVRASEVEQKYRDGLAETVARLTSENTTLRATMRDGGQA